MGIFGTFSFQEKSKKKETKFLSLLDMARQKFGDDPKLMYEIKLYLDSRIEQNNKPTKTAWDLQLNILEQIEKNKRIMCVHNSTIKGYRQLAYLPDKHIMEEIDEVSSVDTLDTEAYLASKNEEIIINEAF